MLQIVLFLPFLFADPAPQISPEQQNWLRWKQKTLNKALTSPTSFLNAYALEQAQPGQSLYLELAENKKSSQWRKQKPKVVYAVAEHLGGGIRIQVKGSTLGYLQNKPKARRKNFKLPNGDVAEVVFGRRNKKLWGYLYDPKQIESFTGFRFYDYNPAAVVKGQFKKQKPRFVSYKTVQGDPTKVHQVGNVSFSINNKDYFLPAYNWQKPGESKDYVALIFTDETKGSETYAGGRELVIDMPNGLVDSTPMVLDFNKTLNFYCAHSPFWHCPVGLQKHLEVKLKAGEMLPEKKIM